MRTLTTLDRFGLVTWREGQPYLRMLQVEELKAAMGFRSDYILQRGNRRDRIRLLGNGVCPPVMEHIIKSLRQPQPSMGAEADAEFEEASPHQELLLRSA
jgi:DNA (cytosine-5)-methyltransferase 1